MAGHYIADYMTHIQIQPPTLRAATKPIICDGAKGTVPWCTQLQTTAMPLVGFNFQAPLRGSPDNLLEVATPTAVAGGVHVNAQGFVAA